MLFGWLSTKNVQATLIYPFVRFQYNLAEMLFGWLSTKNVQATLISLTNRATKRHQERCKMTKLYNSTLIKVLVKFQDTNGFYWQTISVTECPLLAVSFELLIKFSQIFAAKYLLLIYYHSVDISRAILALLLTWAC